MVTNAMLHQSPNHQIYCSRTSIQNSVKHQIVKQLVDESYKLFSQKLPS